MAFLFETQQYGTSIYNKINVTNVVKNGRQLNAYFFILNTVSTLAITSKDNKYVVEAIPIPINNGPNNRSEK